MEEDLEDDLKQESIEGLKQKLDMILVDANHLQEQRKRVEADYQITETRSRAFDEHLLLMSTRLEATKKEYENFHFDRANSQVERDDQGRVIRARTEQVEEAPHEVPLPEISYDQWEDKLEGIFENVLMQKFSDDKLFQTLTHDKALSKELCVNVGWGNEIATWIYDVEENDDISFEVILEDACRYWDINPMDAVLLDSYGAVWPMDSMAEEELQADDNGNTPKITLSYRHTTAMDAKKIKFGYAEADQDGLSDSSADDRLQALIASREASAKERARRNREHRDEMIGELRKFLAFMIFLNLMVIRRRQVEREFNSREAVIGALGEGFEKIATFTMFWDWLKGDFLESVFPPELDWSNGGTAMIQSYAKIVGGIRLRQMRVEPGMGCKVPVLATQEVTAEAWQKINPGTTRQTETRRFVEKCFSPYRQSTKAISPRYLRINGTDSPVACNGTNTIQEWSGFCYRTGAENNMTLTRVVGEFATYDGSGYTVDIGLKQDEMERIFDYLYNNTWLDRQTRAVMVTANMYNGNYNLLIVCSFLLELAPGGTISAVNQITTMKLDLWQSFTQSQNEAIAMVMEGAVYLQVVWMTFMELYQICRSRLQYGSFWHYFGDSWNFLEVLFLLTFFITAFIRVLIVNEEELKYVIQAEGGGWSTRYIELSSYAFMFNTAYYIDALTLFMCFVKLFKYFPLNHNLNMLWKTLSRASQDLSLFCITLGLLLFGFVLMSHNLFGTVLESYSTPEHAFITCFLLLMGDFDYNELSESGIFGQIFFWFYMIFMFLIMVNVFIAILTDSYTAVQQLFQKEEIATKQKKKIFEVIMRINQRLKERRLERKLAGMRRKQKKEEKKARKKQIAQEKKMAAASKKMRKTKRGDKTKTAATAAATQGGPANKPTTTANEAPQTTSQTTTKPSS